MFDLRWIRESPEAFDTGLTRRGLEPASARVLDLDARRRQAQTELQELQTARNTASKAIGEAKGRGQDAEAQMAEVARIKETMAKAEAAEREVAAELDELLSGLPNTPAPDVPDGPDESANVCLRTVGEAPAFDFEPKQHFDLGEALGLLDFETAAKLSGARFVVMRGALARLHRAIANFMIDLHTEEHGYTEVMPPYLVRDHVLYGTGQLPKFGDDLFITFSARDQDRFWADYDAARDAQFEEFRCTQETQEERRRKSLMRQREWHERFQSDEYARPLWLIPTAEVPLTNLVAGDILDEAALPLRVTALTPCFRSEAGAAGKDTRGMLRQHQFDKVEMVSIAHPERSEEELERMTACAEEVLKRLGLHYRVVVLSTGDMGFGARKTHDIEVWLPGQGAFREISSCSNCGDFQARRMNARFRPATGKGTRFVHTLNGSGVAVGRALIAVMENYQRADGSFEIPEVLRPFMGGMSAIGSDD
ncbi:MAG: serine--tRNA ligase [Proteobacteria bacterium]|nr:serine--tRNA ligase [Pseudomonadota bacterium]